MSNIKNKNILFNNDNQNQHQNIIDIYPNNLQNYSETKSIYQFFILSLLKNTNISKETAVSIIYNFDKNNFIRIFLNNKDYNKQKINLNLLLNWIKDIKNNYNIIENIFEISNNQEMRNNFYKIISIGLYTNNIEIIAITNSIIKISTTKIKIDLDWFITEGYLIYINNINLFPLIRISLIECLIEIIKQNEKIFFQIITNDLTNNILKEQITLFIQNIFSVKDDKILFNILKKKFFIILEEIYFDYNLSLKQKDIPLILNLITFGWYNNPNIFNSEDNNKNEDLKLKNILLIIFQENIINKYGINCIISIINLFILLNKFGKIKNENGPLVYKTIVNQFINQFENNLKKELFFENFINFFFTNLKFPIDLFLSPYLDKINASQNISLSDFNFISNIISHPRFTCENAYKLIFLLLDYSFKDNIYTKCIIMIINLIFSLDLLFKNEIIFQKTQLKLTEYINDVLNIYKENVINNNDNNIYYRNILEIVYCIIIKKFGNVNDNIKDNLIICLEEYRKINNKNCNELLKLLWHYDIFDDIMLNLEEKYYKENYNKNGLINNNTIKKENIKSNNCILFQKVKKINIFNKEKNNKDMINRREQSLKELNKEMKEKVENDLKKINDTQKNQIYLEKQKEQLLKTKEFTTKQKLLKLLYKRSLFLGIPNTKKHRPNSHKIEKKGGYVLEEGEGDLKYPYGKLIYKRKNSKMKLNTLLIYNKYKFIVNFYDEEPREIKGIEGLNQKYKNQIKFLFNKLSDNYNTISKSNILKFLRQKNITNDDLSLDELSFCIKNAFPNENLICFNENEFKKLLIAISYYIMNKNNYMNTIYECYYNFLTIILKKTKNDEKLKNNKYLKIKQYLKDHLDIKNGKINRLLPPGFKVIQKTNVCSFKQFPKHFKKNLSESIIICYTILDEIILKALKCKHGILENYIKIYKEYDIDFETSKIKPWTQDLMIAYSLLPKEYNLIGIEIASLLEEELRKICLGKNIELEETINNKIKIYNKSENKIITDNIQINKNNELKEKIELKEINNIRNIKINKEENDKNYEKEIFNNENKLKIIKNNNIQQFNNIAEIKFKSDKNNNKIKSKFKEKIDIDKKLNNINMSKEKKARIFLTEQNKKIERELEFIKKNRKLKELKKRNLSGYLPKIDSNYLKENKEYIELDKKLLVNIKNIINNNSQISNNLNKYNNHLKLIFDVYHKLGLNSISSINCVIDNSLCYNEFKEFLINFGILNTIISLKQMNFIFKRLSRKNKSLENNNIINNNKPIDKIEYQHKSYLTFNDFKLSLLLIVILSNMENDNIQIMKSNYDYLNEKLVELLFNYLELIIPFFRRDIEDMINQRRNMNNKDYKEWKKKKKKDLLNIFNNLNINKNVYSILLKKIKTNFDILPSFSEPKIKKVLSDKILVKKKIKKNQNNSNEPI